MRLHMQERYPEHIPLLVALQGHKNWVLCLAWSPDAKYLVSGSMDGQVLVWQADTGTLKGVCKVSAPHTLST